ncbi:MAG TPA: hypothetical protein VFE47_31460 [Tepidisphaeraceae bacterium]|jgi:hypothetical protein|nr:hypothetical protein [Tepidisphaeraceae bacterium]
MSTIPPTNEILKMTIRQCSFIAVFAIAFSISTALAQTPAPGKIPKPQFQGDYFGEMARAFCTIQEVDVKGRALVVRREKDSQIVRVPIRDDTELRFRDSWGELSDYFPGQRIMLFVYVDENKNWTYPRAVQDEIQVSAAHGWYAAVTAIDLKNNTYATHREEKDKDGKVTKVIDKQYTCAPGAVLWKSAKPQALADLKIGDEVIEQQKEIDGQLRVIEILDRKGDAAVRAKQELAHHRAQDEHGLPAYVNDIEVISGSLLATVAWSGAERAASLKPGDLVTFTPTDGSAAFAAAIASSEHVDSRIRLHLAINARVAARLSIGQSLRLFLPGAGPQTPTGKSGVPANAFQTP